ncbi:MAG TPA: hypothetical protein VNW29_05480 [Candidatus Sulfotelmatobacter sp.]|jgi:hypothetical protein|nr:hypothetical protein [Candidatus Sulfotelmatobacter sp.]
MKKQSINLTKKQFKSLLKVVYLGNWMVNAYRTDDTNEEYESIEDLIFSYAPQFGFEKYISHEEADGDKYYPTNDFEETTDVHKLHEAYDEETFWDELAERLGERDFLEKYSKKEIEDMKRDEWFIKLEECIEKYNEEFEKKGLERIRKETN